MLRHLRCDLASPWVRCYRRPTRASAQSDTRQRAPTGHRLGTSSAALGLSELGSATSAAPAATAAAASCRPWPHRCAMAARVDACRDHVQLRAGHALEFALHQPGLGRLGSSPAASIISNAALSCLSCGDRSHSHCPLQTIHSAHIAGHRRPSLCENCSIALTVVADAIWLRICALFAVQCVQKADMPSCSRPCRTRPLRRRPRS